MIERKGDIPDPSFEDLVPRPEPKPVEPDKN